MIPFFFKVFFVGMLVAFSSWALALVRGAPSSPGVDSSSSELALAIGDPAVARSHLAFAEAARSLPAQILPLLSDSRVLPRIEKAAHRTALRLAVALEFFPLVGHLFAAGVALGLSCREASRHGLRFASPTQAYLAKYVAGIAAIAIGLFAVTPISLPFWTLPAGTAALSFGGFAYVANMPIKL